MKILIFNQNSPDDFFRVVRAGKPDDFTNSSDLASLYKAGKLKLLSLHGKDIMLLLIDEFQAVEQHF